MAGQSIYRRAQFDPDKAERICQVFAEGFETEDGTIKRLNVTEVCREVGITLRTLRVWLSEWPDFHRQYKTSLELYADRLVEEALIVAADTSKDFYDQTAATGVVSSKPNVVAVNRAKLHVETLLRVAGKFSPEKYGDSLKINSTSVVVHVDETAEGKLRRIDNILRSAKEQGYDTKEIRARFEVLLSPEEEIATPQNVAQKMLDNRQTIVMPASKAFEKSNVKVQESVA